MRKEVLDALQRRAERAARHLDIRVSPDGVVTLAGPVRSWKAKEAIIGAARFTPGVSTVDDQLHVDPVA